MDVHFLQTSELYRLVGLSDEQTGGYVNNADVELTIRAGPEITDSAVSGETWPLVMDYVAGSNGDYVATVIDSVDMTENRTYYAFVVVAAGGLKLTKRVPVRAIWNE